MPARALRAVLYDWDGTLADSAEASYRSYQRVFAAYAIPFDRDRFQETYSPNWYETYRGIGLPEALWAEADARWLQEYAREECRLLPGVAEALALVGQAGLRQGLVTSGSRERVARDIVATGVDRYFGVVVCGEDATQRKPHPEALLLALDRLGIAATEAAYVGDSPEDVAMARAAGAFPVGIPGGFPNRGALLSSGPDVMANTLGEAVRVLVEMGGSGRLTG
jgi:HAD superfamily hydrolase (TIGR01509 family)